MRRIVKMAGTQGSKEPLNIGDLPPVRAKWGRGCVAVSVQ